MAKILVVDDAAFMRIQMPNLLTHLGHEVIGVAENGGEAVTQHNKLHPDIVTMNITMPNLDGVKESSRENNHVLCHGTARNGSTSNKSWSKEFCGKTRSG